MSPSDVTMTPRLPTPSAGRGRGLSPLLLAPELGWGRSAGGPGVQLRSPFPVVGGTEGEGQVYRAPSAAPDMSNFLTALMQQGSAQAAAREEQERAEKKERKEYERREKKERKEYERKEKQDREERERKEKQDREEYEKKEKQDREERERKERKERDDRREAREKEKEDRRLAKEEKESKEKREREEKERVAKVEEAGRLREHEERLALLLQNRSHQGPGAQGATQIRVPHLKLPVWKDGEDLDQFLLHFEHACSVTGVSVDHRAAYLSSVLSGRAREALNDMPDKTDYGAIVVALRKQFHLTPEAYRRKFRDLKKLGTESFPQFAVRLSRSLEYWEKMSGTNLRDLVLIEQFLTCAPEGVGTYIREQQCKDLVAVGLAAENYTEARQNRQVNSPAGRDSRQSAQEPRSTQKFGSDRSGARAQSVGGSQRRVGAPEQGSQSRGNCYTCDQPGHLARDCPKRRGGPGGAPPGRK